MNDQHRYTTPLQLFDQKRRRQYLPKEEWHRLVDVLSTAPLADRYLVLTLLQTGMRSIEVARLRPCDIRVNRRCIRVESAKKRSRGIYRTVLVASWFIHALSEFAETLPPLAPIWPVSRWTILKKTKAYMQQAEVPSCRQTVRALRHTYACTLIEEIPIHMISQWLGHSRLETTMTYLQIQEDPRIAAAVEAAWGCEPPC